jgi:hypothetical protein
MLTTSEYELTWWKLTKKWNCSRFNKKFQQCNTFSQCNPCFRAPSYLGTLSPSHNSQQHFIVYTNNITQFTHPSDCSWIPLSLSSLLEVWPLNTWFLCLKQNTSVVEIFCCLRIADLPHPTQSFNYLTTIHSRNQHRDCAEKLPFCLILEISSYIFTSTKLHQ